MAETVVGLKELGDTLDLLAKKTEKEIIRKAANAGAEVYRRELRAKAPVRQDKYLKGKIKRGPGYLKKHIGRTAKADSDGYSVKVGPTKSAFYGGFREHGTSHEAAQPWVRPVFDAKTGEAEKTFADVAGKGIEEAVHG